MEVAILAKITCPHCGFVEDAEMLVYACQFSHQCVNCRTVIRPKAGDCCVFCSYADVRCPSKQTEIPD